MGMAVKLTAKFLANSLILKPSALLRNMSGVLDVFIFSVKQV